MTRIAVAGVLGLVLASGCAAPAASRAPLPCEHLETFADGKVPTEVHHVATSGSDEQGDGSERAPFRSIGRAVRNAVPGVAVRVHAGTYDGGLFLANLHGTAEQPIWIAGAPGEVRPILSGGRQGIVMTRPRYVMLDHLEIAQTADNGINVDDGEEMENPEAARFVVFKDLDIHDTGQNPSGVAGCLKLAGVNDVMVIDSTFARCGKSPESGALGVNGVGVQRGVIAGSQFRDTGFGGIQFKGGSRDIAIIGNRFDHAGWRGVNMGGSTGGPFFRPPLTPRGPAYEATRIRVSDNVFVGGEAAAAFAGCVDCEFAGNTVVDPQRWALRILQETVSLNGQSFAATGHGLVAGNLFYFRRADLATGEDINVGVGTDSATFTLAGNHWYAHDDPPRSSPRLPTFLGARHDETEARRPDFVDERAGNFRVRAGAGAGTSAGCQTDSP